MANTPLYKKMKSRGTSFYAFPGAADDISAAYQNQNYKMYFSKYVLLNLPQDNSSVTFDPGSTVSVPTYFNFDEAFEKSTNSGFAVDFSERMIESLRNYVANFEVTMKESKLNNTEYYYNQNSLSTPSEKIFWKWCKKLNLFDLEPANPGDEYFDNLNEFQRNSLTDEAYFPEILWRERQTRTFDVIDFYETGNLVYINKLELLLESSSTLKVNDLIKVNLPGMEDWNIKVLAVIPPEDNINQRIIVDVDSTETSNPALNKGTITLLYNKFVQYIGEVNGVNNVQEANRSYSEVYAHIPDHTGQTPDVLFRLTNDDNYSPNLQFPIIPSQIQPEIVGAEIFSNPIVNTPQNYPGDYYGQFDTEFFTYETSSGDQIRRSGDYYGISGTIEDFTIDSSLIDGMIVDFDTTHYVKMNVIGDEITNFDQFNAMTINNQPPNDFEFNAILWYYTVEDIKGNKTSNLYGISFVDNPNNNDIEDETGLRIQTLKKLVANDDQDGVSYIYTLNLNFNINNENPQDTYNPEAINSLFGFNLFNEAMTRLSKSNDSFMSLLTKSHALETELLRIKQLIYTQTDLNNINKKIANLDLLLKLYSTNQITSSDTIEVTLDTSVTPPQVRLDSKDTLYGRSDVFYASNMYDSNGIIAQEVLIPNKKNLLISVINDDTTDLDFGDNNLTIVLSRDLDLLQSVQIVVNSTDTSLENKKLDIFVNRNEIDEIGAITIVKNEIVQGINLPIYYKSNDSTGINISKWMDKFPYNIIVNDLANAKMEIIDDKLVVPIDGLEWMVNDNITQGDALMLNDFILNNGDGNRIDFSGQYIVDEVVFENNYMFLYLDVSRVDDLNIISEVFNDPNSEKRLVTKPYFTLNKGYNINITRASISTDDINQDYIIDIRPF